LRFKISSAAALVALIFSLSPAAAAPVTITYDVAGTFETLTGSDYADLSGGSFSGTFTVPSGTFPLSGNEYSTFSNFTLNIYNVAHQPVQTLTGTTPGADLVITNDYTSYYGGGEQVLFDVNGTDYLQLNLSTSFNGSGSILPDDYSYAEIGPGNYAYLATGTISPLATTPLPSTGTMMLAALLGFGAVDLMRRRKRSSKSALAAA
jgi:hypothetical protein